MKNTHHGQLIWVSLVGEPRCQKACLYRWDHWYPRLCIEGVEGRIERRQKQLRARISAWLVSFNRFGDLGWKTVGDSNYIYQQHRRKLGPILDRHYKGQYLFNFRVTVSAKSERMSQDARCVNRLRSEHLISRSPQLLSDATLF